MQELIPFLQLFHASFNVALLAAFLFQGTLGWRIRRGRLSGGTPDLAVVRRHRGAGPVLVAFGFAGYAAGLLVSFLHRGTLLVAPAHLAGGTVLLACCTIVALLGRRIRGPQSPGRTPHFAAGLVTLGVFVVQVVLGLDALL